MQLSSKTTATGYHGEVRAGGQSKHFCPPSVPMVRKQWLKRSGRLGLVAKTCRMPDKKKVQSAGKSGTRKNNKSTPTKTKKSGGGSESHKHSEWSDILDFFWASVGAGDSVEAAIERTANQGWQHHQAGKISAELSARAREQVWTQKGKGMGKQHPTTTTPDHSYIVPESIVSIPNYSYAGNYSPIRQIQRKATLRDHFLCSTWELARDHEPARALEMIKTIPHFAAIKATMEAWQPADWEKIALDWLNWQRRYGQGPRYWCSWEWFEQLHKVLETREGSEVRAAAILPDVVALHPPRLHDYQDQGSSIEHLRRGLRILAKAGILQKKGSTKTLRYLVPQNYRALLTLREEQLTIENTKPKTTMTTQPTNPTPSEKFILLSKADQQMLLQAAADPELAEKHAELLAEFGVLPSVPATVPSVLDDDPPEVPEGPKKLRKVPPISKKAWEKEQAKLARLAARKAKLAEETAAMQSVLVEETETAWKKSGLHLDLPQIREIFEREYRKLLLGVGFKLAFDKQTKSKKPFFCGFSLASALNYIVPAGAVPAASVVYRLKALTAGAELVGEKAEVYKVPPGYLSDDPEAVLDGVERAIKAGDSTFKKMEVQEVLVLDIQAKILRDNASLLACILPTADGIDEHGALVPGAYQGIWQTVRMKVSEKFEAALKAAVAKDWPLLAPSVMLAQIHLPRRSGGGRRYIYRAPGLGDILPSVETAKKLADRMALGAFAGIV